MASITSTIESGFGNRVMTNGFLLNNELTDFSFEAEADGAPVANRVEGGKRPRSSMAPTIVLKDGAPVLLIGSPGGSRIIPYVAASLVGILDFGLTPQEAIDRPHVLNRNGPTDIEEGPGAEEMAAALAALGHETSIRDLNSGLHVIAIGPDGTADRSRRQAPRRRRSGRVTMIRALLLGLAALALAACSGRPDLETQLGGPSMALEEYFDGDLVAWGQVQDRFGTVRSRFEVDITGTWDGETLTLVEDFVYDDARTEQRIWTLRKTGANTWAGTAPGVIGEATGEVRGDTFNWRYTIDLPLGDGETLRADFDDWMWRLDEERVLNRAYMNRFGIRLAEVIIFFERR